VSDTDRTHILIASHIYESWTICSHPSWEWTLEPWMGF
jgi:hypothetical protein